jgi:hypothetical protein
MWHRSVAIRVTSKYVNYSSHVCVVRSVWQRAYDTAALVCRCINVWRLPVPTQMTSLTGDEKQQYKINYARWMELCYVPRYANCLPAYVHVITHIQVLSVVDTT